MSDQKPLRQEDYVAMAEENRRLTAELTRRDARVDELLRKRAAGGKCPACGKPEAPPLVVWPWTRATVRVILGYVIPFVMVLWTVYRGWWRW